jgi:hypothetical protein
MKRITIVALFAAASMVGLGNAFAQGYAVRATMPFDFSIGSKVLPAGTYKINRFHNDLIEIQNQDKDIAILSTSFSDDAQSKNGAVLIFDKCGDQYFLREVLLKNPATAPTFEHRGIQITAPLLIEGPESATDCLRAACATFTSRGGKVFTIW